MNVEGEGSSSSKSEFGVMHKESFLGLVASFTLSSSAFALRSLGVLKLEFSYDDSRCSAAHGPQTSETLSPESKTDRAMRFAA